MANKTDPGKRLDTNMYETPNPKVGRLPQTLHGALGQLEQSKVLKAGLGENFIASYLKLKRGEWNRYLGQVSAWERETYLDV